MTTTTKNDSFEIEKDAISIEVGKDASSVSKISNILRTSLPRSKIVFFSQMFIVCIIIIASIYNLSIGEEKTSLWLSLLTSSCSYLIPPPRLKRE